MKITVLETKTICDNPDSALHNYFAWPSVARLQDGSLAMVASGFRIAHICPFGKSIMTRSYDEGKTWSRPTVIIDTPLDDRDSGIVPFGENSHIVTSFNNTIAAQRGWNAGKNAYIDAYLDKIDAKAAESRYLGSTFVISNDGGVTYSEVKRMPVTSPHGPCVLNDGSLLYVGRTFSPCDTEQPEDHIAAYLLHPDGSYEKRGDIENVTDYLLSCEPHAICLPSGKIIVHIRVQGGGQAAGYQDAYFTIYQSESYDGGFTFTKPHPILDKTGGAPAHLLCLPDGRLISVYGYRNPPYGIKVMISEDEGQSWDTGHDLYVNGITPDLGYPASVLLENGNILTVFYAHTAPSAPASILQTVWRID